MEREGEATDERSILRPGVTLRQWGGGRNPQVEKETPL